ncbi:hypothetical protein P3342_008026 [Pyrenophora teres f. teres]|nr:hypothetical protein P3342_008026 [Pyrenophora teres f. teres]
MCRGYMAKLGAHRTTDFAPLSDAASSAVVKGAQCDVVASRWDEDSHLLGRMFEAQSGGAAYHGPVAAVGHAARRPVSHKLGVAAGLTALPEPMPPPSDTGVMLCLSHHRA